MPMPPAAPIDNRPNVLMVIACIDAYLSGDEVGANELAEQTTSMEWGLGVAALLQMLLDLYDSPADACIALLRPYPEPRQMLAQLRQVLVSSMGAI